MDRCEVSGCYSTARFLLTTANAHLKTCGGCVAYGMEQIEALSAFIIDLKKVEG